MASCTLAVAKRSALSWRARISQKCGENLRQYRAGYQCTTVIAVCQDRRLTELRAEACVITPAPPVEILLPSKAGRRAL